jgi:hypothetical protein
LIGDLHTIDTRTGATLTTVPTASLPDGVIYKACGNRRTTICPSCAEIYRRDAYHLIRSGLAGGKSVPVSVAKHPAVFATFTAPSFGPVHSRHVKVHHCTGQEQVRVQTLTVLRPAGWYRRHLSARRHVRVLRPP